MLEIDKLEDELQRKSADRDFAVLDLHKFKVISHKISHNIQVSNSALQTATIDS